MIFPDQIVSLHTRGGVQLYQFTPPTTTSLTWGRELRQVSKCDLVAPSDGERIPDIIPWLHWMSVWDDRGEELFWTGPVQKVVGDATSTAITANDAGALLSKTRCPVAKKWDSTDPTIIAGELWAAVLAHHGIGADPVVRYDPLGQHYDYTVTGDSQMMDTVMSDLAGRGLHWSVVAGTPILGRAPLKPVAAIGEADFVGAPFQLTRDGSRTFNDVLLRGGDALARARLDMGGLSLQTNVDINDMFGVSDVEKAVRLYLTYVAQMRDLVTLPSGATLHPDAPVSRDMLVPTTRFVIEAYGVQSLMQLTTMSVTSTAGKCDVGVGFEAVDDHLPELVKIVNSGGMS